LEDWGQTIYLYTLNLSIAVTSMLPFSFYFYEKSVDREVKLLYCSSFALIIANSSSKEVEVPVSSSCSDDKLSCKKLTIPAGKFNYFNLSCGVAETRTISVGKNNLNVIVSKAKVNLNTERNGFSTM
jgi:hypothetical protein